MEECAQNLIYANEEKILTLCKNIVRRLKKQERWLQSLK